MAAIPTYPIAFDIQPLPRFFIWFCFHVNIKQRKSTSWPPRLIKCSKLEGPSRRTLSVGFAKVPMAVTLAGQISIANWIAKKKLFLSNAETRFCPNASPPIHNSFFRLIECPSVCHWRAPFRAWVPV